MNDIEMQQECERIVLEKKVGEKVEEQLASLEKKLKDSLGEIAWQACNDYVEYSTYEPLCNWRDRARDDLLKEGYHTDKGYWGKTMRASIYEEHKEVILPLIKNELIESLQKEVASLKEQLAREVEYSRKRY